MDIEATKTWKSSAGDTINDKIKNAQVTFELQSQTKTDSTWSEWAKVTKNAKGADIINPVTVSVETANAEDWKTTWNNLLKNENIQYRVIETYAKVGDDELVTEGSEPTQSVSFVSGSNTGTANIDNTLPTTQISVKKTWEGKENAWPDDHVQVEMTLKANGAKATSLPNSQDAVVKLTKDTPNHTFTWTNLPVYDDEGAKISYTVAETGLWYQPDSGDAVKFIANDLTDYFDITPEVSDDGTAFTIDNTPKTTQIKVTKEWTVNKVAVTDKDKIAFQLRRTDGTTVTMTKDQMSVDFGEKVYATYAKICYVPGYGWQTVTISDLPKYKITVNSEAAAFQPIEYYVEEVRDTTGGNANSSITYQVENNAEPPKAEQPNAENAYTNDGTITIINRDTDITLKVLKVDITNQSNYLTGAEFQLQKKSGDQYLTYMSPTFPDSPYTEAEGDQAKLTIATATDGITFRMLSDGDYQLVETRAPAGYVMPVAMEIRFTVENGAIKDDIPTDGIVVNYVRADESGNPVVTIGNTPGSRLPATGGMGTTVVYVAGSALLLLAVLGWVLSARKRRE